MLNRIFLLRTVSCPRHHPLYPHKSQVIVMDISHHLFLMGRTGFSINTHSGNIFLNNSLLPSFSIFYDRLSEVKIKIIVQCSSIPSFQLKIGEQVYIEIFINVVVLRYPHFLDKFGSPTNLTFFIPRNVTGNIGSLYDYGMNWQLTNGSKAAVRR